MFVAETAYSLCDLNTGSVLKLSVRATLVKSDFKKSTFLLSMRVETVQEPTLFTQGINFC